MIRVLLDHMCVQALAEGDEFLNGLYAAAGHGHAELVVPALSAVAADRERHGPGSTCCSAGSSPWRTTPAITP